MNKQTLIIFLSALTISVLLASVVVVNALTEKENDINNLRQMFFAYASYTGGDATKVTESEKMYINRYFFAKEAGLLK